MFQVTNRPTFETIGVTRYRQLLEKSTRVFKPDPEIKKDSLNILGIQSEWLTPPNPDKNSIIMYVHGGGYIAGSINSHRDLASRLAKASGSKLLLFDYRLAPEHPFPAGLEDAKTIYHWLIKNYSDTHQISLAGDSAGGGLALALMSDLMAGSHRLPQSMVLFSPWTDLECKNPSHAHNENKDFMLNRNILEKTARMYTSQKLSNPLISPINNGFKQMPPTLIQVGENEVLLDDSKLLAEKIRQDNPDSNPIVRLEVWEGMFHVWHYFAKYLSEAREAITRAGLFIQTHSPPS